MNNNAKTGFPMLLIALVLTLQAEAGEAKSEPRQAAIPDLSTLSLPTKSDEQASLRFAFAHEAQSFWRLARTDPIARIWGKWRS
jgi:hypothetical protein